MAKPYERLRSVHVGPIGLVTRRRRPRRSSTAAVAPRVTRDVLAKQAAADPDAREIVDRIDGLSWYHTIDLGHGVETPGFADHRAQLPHYGLPASLAGKRVLDVATFDGYWAFEFERRGADEVVAIDIAKRTDLDCPRWMLRDPESFDLVGGMGESFKVAHDILGSKVKRIERSVYDLDPAIDGMFDVVFISDVLVHLRDPQLAIERAYSVCRGELIIADMYSPELDALGDIPVARFIAPGETWWYPNVACLKQMMLTAGFEPITEVSRFTLDALGTTNHKVVLRGTANPEPPWVKSQRAARARRVETRKVMTT